MDVSKMYVPNPQYEQIARGEHNAYINNKNRRTVQKGGSIDRSTVGFMDSIGPSSSRQKQLSERIEMVSPVQQVVDQARSETNRIKYRNKRKNQTKESKQPKKTSKEKHQQKWIQIKI
jgi:hypothetical protein